MARMDQDIGNTDLIFIVTQEGHNLVKVNTPALDRLDGFNSIGQPIDELIHIETDIKVGGYETPAYFDGEWFSLQQETIAWQGSFHIKIRLIKRKEIPSVKVMQSLKSMIGFLLHRLRSPLTGIRGYTELMEKEPDEDYKYLAQVNQGVDQLLNLLDELESLEGIPLEQPVINNHSVNPTEIIGEILSNYPKEVQTNIIFNPVLESDQLSCNPGDLLRILSILIENAVVHAPIDKHQIKITQPSLHSIQVSHDGNTIPKSISQNLFHPFVTTRARKLGIGLTRALLYAKRYNGSIFLTENNPYGKVSFLFCLPPY